MVKKITLILSLLIFSFTSCMVRKNLGTQSSSNLSLINPALPGDNPDPSIIRIGDTYYATSTTNEWAPYFTIYKSKDLKRWTLINHVFPEGYQDMKDQWGENMFWASELAYDADQQRVYAYYTAHNRAVSGNPGLQCGIAWIDVDQIETGKFTDNGPVIIEKGCGAIDAFELKDQGKIYAFWKNDGNGCGQATWIWMQEINKSRTQLIGEKKKLFTTSQPWEDALVEGASFFKKGDYYYSLYAVGGCCDARCNYKTGIARTKDLASGVWEKYEKNPIMVSNDTWRCPGHGTTVETPEGRLFMLYHAFNKRYDVFVGREGILEELIFNEDGWPVVRNTTVPNRPIKDLNFTDDFTKDRKLNLAWQWPSKAIKPNHQFNEGLHLAASQSNHELGTFLGQYIKTTHFSLELSCVVSNAETGIALGGAIAGSKWPGELGAIGMSASTKGIQIFNNLNKSYQVVSQKEEALKGSVQLKMTISNQMSLITFYQLQGKEWLKIYETSFEPAKYAPWGMGYRAGIISKGAAGQTGHFQSFKLINHE